MKASNGMRVLLGSPVPVETVSGPATVARELSTACEAAGDTVTAITFSPFEKKLPVGVRQAALFLRALPVCMRNDAVFLLDPASVGPALALAAKVTGRRCTLRLGGDFLWEAYVERTQEPLRLSEFYAAPKALSLKEKQIRNATRFTLGLVSTAVFTTRWMLELWEKPYELVRTTATVIPPALPSREPLPAKNHSFMCAGRGMRIKNGAIMKEVWKKVAEVCPDAVLDDVQRPPAEYREAIKECYAVIVPSLSEVSPNAALEALRYGKPFIATEDTGIYEELKVAGTFVDTRNPDAIAEAVIALMNPANYQSASDRLRAFVTVRSWESVASAYRATLTA